MDEESSAVVSHMRLLYRVEEAAAMLSISRHRIYELIRSGELATVTIGKSRRVPLASVTAYVEQLMVVGAGDDDAA